MAKNASSTEAVAASARFVIGIDLGTTNSAVCYVDSQETTWQIRSLSIPQLTAAGQVETRENLPSFLYQPAAGELSEEAMRLPWENASAAERSKLESKSKFSDAPFVAGVFARDHGAGAPWRMINSAKSWLCHNGVDRFAAILPWQSADDVRRISPVEAGARYLRHMREAWNSRFPREPMERQDVVLTLPASFDEVARELTVKAAHEAGLPRVVLIEEPQAAFYSWIHARRDDWESVVSPGQKILVCDVGGGTSDFTLIRVRRGEEGKIVFHRIAVGEHLILGGDNLDLALAKHVESRFAGSENDVAKTTENKLTPRQWAALVRASRVVKETLLGPNAPERWTVHLPGGGKRLIGGGISADVRREEAESVLIDGFFPFVRLDDKPRQRRSGFQEFGLPFAPEPAVTRYLAAFLSAHRNLALEDVDLSDGRDPARPDVVLFNGGVFESPAIKKRMIEAVSRWFSPSEQAWSPVVLENDRLDLAVARGAAYYGMVRRGHGVRIAAGLARTYYVGVGAKEEASSSQPREAAHAVCLVPAKIEPGHDVVVENRPFQLLISEPVEFPLFVSSTRLTEAPGDLIPVDPEQMRALPPIRTVLRSKKNEAESVPVKLHARLTEIGTLDLWCEEIEGRRSWRLQFDVRTATQTDVAAHESDAEEEGFVDESIWSECRELIVQTFGPNAQAKPDGLVKRLAAAIGQSRDAWPSSLCRRIWETLIECEAGRRRNPSAESKWINLLGFCLRPGFGLALDDWRVEQTWSALQGKFAYPSSRAEGWILWRRIGGGLAAGQQQALAEPILGPVRSLHRQLTTGRGRGDLSYASRENAEMWRLLGSLELLSVETKIELGGLFLDLLEKKKIQPIFSAIIWAVGRIGARIPFHGPLNTVVPSEIVGNWIERVLQTRSEATETVFAVVQLARRTNDRYRDLDEKSRRLAADFVAASGVPPHFAELIRSGGELQEGERSLAFGESLPKGLRLV